MKDTCILTGNPVFKPLVNRLRTSIESGKILPGQRVGSEMEMVQETGLSRKSVRKAIDFLIHDGLVERRPGKGIFVREPHSTVKVVQLVVPDMGSELWTKIYRAVQTLGVNYGIQVQAYDAYHTSQVDIHLQVIRNLPRSGVDGAIINPIPDPRFAEVVQSLKRHRYPFVLMEEPWRDGDYFTVSSDNYRGGYLVGKELASRGHRSIAYLGVMTDYAARRRMEGMRDAILDAGLPFDRSLVMDLELENLYRKWTKEVDRCVRRLMERPDRPTALFFCNDGAAADGYLTLKAMGISIPGDVSIVGYDDSENICRLLEPNLTSIRPPIQKTGQEALELLMKQFADPSARPEHRIPVEPEWISRGSVGSRPEK